MLTENFIAIDKLEQTNTIICPFCYSTRVYPVVGSDVKIKNKHPPYQEVKITNIDGLYCVDCKTAYSTTVDKVIQQCRDISGDSNFYPESGEENINEKSV